MGIRKAVDAAVVLVIIIQYPATNVHLLRCRFCRCRQLLLGEGTNSNYKSQFQPTRLLAPGYDPSHGTMAAPWECCRQRTPYRTMTSYCSCTVLHVVPITWITGSCEECRFSKLPTYLPTLNASHAANRASPSSFSSS